MSYCSNAILTYTVVRNVVEEDELGGDGFRTTILGTESDRNIVWCGVWGGGGDDRSTLCLLRVSSCRPGKSARLLTNINPKTRPLPSLISCFGCTANGLISLRSYTIITKHFAEVITVSTNAKLVLIPQISIVLVMFLVNRKRWEDILN